MTALESAFERVVQHARMAAVSEMQLHPGFQYWAQISVSVMVLIRDDQEEFGGLALVVPGTSGKADHEAMAIVTPTGKLKYSETPIDGKGATPYVILDHLPDEAAPSKKKLVLTEALIDDGPQAEASAGAPGDSPQGVYPVEYVRRERAGALFLAQGTVDGAWSNATGRSLSHALSGSHGQDVWTPRYREDFIYGYITYGMKYAEVIPDLHERAVDGFVTHGGELALTDRYAQEFFSDEVIEQYRRAAERRAPKARRTGPMQMEFGTRPTFLDRSTGTPEDESALQDIEADEDFERALLDAASKGPRYDFCKRGCHHD
jgi:hypothetical protein